MLEKPDIADEQLISCLQRDYGLRVSRIEFLPLGADINTAVYRVITDGEASYFLKLRRDSFDELSVIIPGFLRSHSVENIIASMGTLGGQLWASVDRLR